MVVGNREAVARRVVRLMGLKEELMSSTLVVEVVESKTL